MLTCLTFDVTAFTTPVEGTPCISTLAAAPDHDLEAWLSVKDRETGVFVNTDVVGMLLVGETG